MFQGVAEKFKKGEVKHLHPMVAARSLLHFMLGLSDSHCLKEMPTMQGAGSFLWVNYRIYGRYLHVAVCQNLVPLVNIKIAGKWMFIPLKKVLIGIDPYPCISVYP
jgi:hypothetical protein